MSLIHLLSGLTAHSGACFWDGILVMLPAENPAEVWKR
jgi:hypothetical protein